MDQMSSRRNLLPSPSVIEFEWDLHSKLIRLFLRAEIAMIR